MNKTILTLLAILSCLGFTKSVFSQSLNEVCSKIRIDMQSVKTKISSNSKLDELNLEVGVMLEDWKSEEQTYNKVCRGSNNANCLEGSNLWKKAQAAKQMQFYMNIVESILSNFPLDQAVVKIDEFDDDTVNAIEDICG